MATNTFVRRIEISDKEALLKLMQVITSEAPQKPLSEHPFSETERERSESLLKQFLSHSGL